MAPITSAIVRQGERLATFEGAEYYALPVVYRINKDGELLFYATLGEWPRTEIGRVAGLLEEVARLQRRNVELEEQIGMQAQIEALPDLEPEPIQAGIMCSCGRRFADKRALGMHQRRAAVHKA